MCIRPPMVYEVTKPNSHSTIRITQIVQSMASSPFIGAVVHRYLYSSGNVKKTRRSVLKLPEIMQLFYNQVVFHRYDPINAAGDLTRLSYAECRID